MRFQIFFMSWISVCIGMLPSASVIGAESVRQVAVILWSHPEGKPISSPRIQFLQEEQALELDLTATRPRYASQGYHRLDQWGAVEYDSKTSFVSLRYCTSPVEAGSQRLCPKIILGRLLNRISQTSPQEGLQAYAVGLLPQVEWKLTTTFQRHQGVSGCNTEIGFNPLCSYDYYTHRSELTIQNSEVKIHIQSRGEEFEPQSRWIFSQTERVTEELVRSSQSSTMNSLSF